MRCPICKKRVDLKSEFAPFCSERCKLIDLGNWASERYGIPVEITEEDLAKIDSDSGPTDDEKER